MSDFVYESGEAITTGFHGETDFVYASGDPVPNNGVSDLVFESGTGLGGGSFVVDGVECGIFETNETHSEFYGFDYGDPTTHATGLEDFGMDDQPNTYTTYVFVHREASTGSIAIGFWHHSEESGSGSMQVDLDGSAGHLDSTPVVTDDEPTEHDADNYETDADGDIYFTHQHGREAGDGVMYEITDPGFEMTAIMSSHPTESDPQTEQWRGRGPDNNNSVSGGAGTSINIQIS